MTCLRFMGTHPELERAILACTFGLLTRNTRVTDGCSLEIHMFLRFLCRATERLCNRGVNGGWSGKRGSMTASQAYPHTFGRAEPWRLWLGLGNFSGFRIHCIACFTEVALLLSLRRSVPIHELAASLRERLDIVLTRLVHEAGWTRADACMFHAMTLAVSCLFCVHEGQRSSVARR